MSIAIKRQLEEIGIKLEIKGDKISAIGVLTDEVCSLIRQNRDALFLALLQDNDQDDAACFLEPEEKFVAEWRHKLNGLPQPTNRDTEALLKAAKEFIDGTFAQTAVDSGWDAVSLFGVCLSAPRHRHDCMGLIPAIAWSSWPVSLVSIDGDCAKLLVSRSGQVLRHPRKLPGKRWSQPFWEGVSPVD